MSDDRHLPEDALTEPLARAQQRHVARCRACSARRANALNIREAIAGLPRVAEPSAHLLALLEHELHGQRPPPRLPRRTWGWAMVAVSACAALVASWWMLSPELDAPMKESLAQQVALDHLHYQGNAQAAEVSGTLDQIADYFARTLHRRPRLSHVEATNVMGGKRCRIDGQWSALVWIERADRWLSLFSLPHDVVANRGCLRASGVNVCGVADVAGGSRLLAGNLPDAEMLRLLDESME